VDPQALRDHLEGEGFTLRASGPSLYVEPASSLTTDHRRLIRAHKAALLGLVAARPTPTKQPTGRPAPRPATPAEAAEIRAHLGRLCGFDHPDYPEALAVALADPDAALDSFRAEDSWPK
jgi:hypothetical protein